MKAYKQKSLSWFAQAFVILLAVVISLGLLEIATRAIVDDGMNFDLEMWKYARHLKQVSDNPEIGHEHVPMGKAFLMGAQVNINSIGLREREIAHKKPSSTVRILMLGDSLTFGWGVKYEDTPAKKLEQRLNDDHPGMRFEVINAGVGNYNSSMEIAAFFDKWMTLDPDLVILNYFINDAEPTPQRRDRPIIEYSAAAVVIASAFDSLSRQYFGKADWRTYYANLYSNGSAAWLQNQAAIGRLATYCKSAGLPLIVVNYPELHQLKPYSFPQVTAKVSRLARSLGIPFVDLLKYLEDQDPETLWVSPTDAHPNAKANVVISAAIQQSIETEFPTLFQ